MGAGRRWVRTAIVPTVNAPVLNGLAATDLVEVQANDKTMSAMFPIKHAIN